MSSVLLDGRIFKAATIDTELAAKLEGATIFEAAHWRSKGNYVIYWYQLSCLKNISGIKAELLKTIDSTPLFHNGCWEPSLIPHVLRHTSLTEIASFSSSGSGPRTCRPRSNPPHRSMHLSPPKQPTTTSGSKRHSRASLRQEPVMCSIPNTDLQETVEGMLIPIAGSEETDIAAWLNQIISLFTPPAAVTHQRCLAT
ncbi:hypothetical protein BKA83DRAFT_4487640 [Pisolithus microcarpus]|nr:hypothetical protein BKA83DRAFT_4487640 [Pisolithus microcarpus]